MSSHTNLPSPKPIPKPDHRLSTPPQPKKPPSSSSSSSLVAPPSSQDQTLKCPRCNSPNTKFCYYNNYSLTQPRHFCKSCRRYWTRGGALRNVPIGGGCRKTKKSIKPNNNSSPSMINTTTLLHHHPPPPYSSQRFISSLMEQDSSRFFPPPPPLPPTTTMDFQLSGLSLKNDLSSSSYQTTIPVDVGSGLSLTGFGDYTNNNNQNYTTAGEAVTTGGNLASSIETLSCLNQDLHWRLQQQRMAMFFGSKDHQESVVVERPQPILYRNLDIVNSSPPSPTRNQTEWYFGNNSDNEGVISNNDTAGGGGGNSNDQWNNGIQAWTDLNHYNALP